LQRAVILCNFVKLKQSYIFAKLMLSDFTNQQEPEPVEFVQIASILQM
jgi:hypothetical protein